MTVLALMDMGMPRTEWQCAGCRITYVGPKPDGWIEETRATINGGTVRYVACFPCRHIVHPTPRWDISSLTRPETMEES